MAFAEGTAAEQNLPLIISLELHQKVYLQILLG